MTQTNTVPYITYTPSVFLIPVVPQSIHDVHAYNQPTEHFQRYSDVHAYNQPTTHLALSALFLCFPPRQNSRGSQKKIVRATANPEQTAACCGPGRIAPLSIGYRSGEHTG